MPVRLPGPLAVVATTLLFVAAGAARADPPVISSAAVSMSESGVPASIDVTVVGGRSPYRGKVFMASAGSVFEETALVESTVPGQLTVPVPGSMHSRPFAFYVEVDDADGQRATRGSADAPVVHGSAEPPVPAAPVPIPEGAALPPPTEPPPPPQDGAGPDPSAPHPPVASGGPRARAEPAHGDDAVRHKRRRVRTERVVECCGVPIWGGGRSALFLLGSAASLLTGVVVGITAVFFVVDLIGTRRMIVAVDSAERRQDALPTGCASYAQCRAPYERAMWMDLGMGGLGLVTAVGFGVLAAALALAAMVLPRE